MMFKTKIKQLVTQAILRTRECTDGCTLVEPHSARTSALITEREPRAFVESLSEGTTSLFVSYAQGSWDSPDLYRLMKSLCEAELNYSAWSAILNACGARFGVGEKSYADIAGHYDQLSPYIEKVTGDIAYSSSPSLRGATESTQSRRLSIEQSIEPFVDGRIEDLRCLDLGCGWGAYSNLFIPWKEWTGVTISGEQCKFIKARLDETQCGKVLQANFLESDLLPNEADVILAIESIEHIDREDRDLFISNLVKKYSRKILILQFSAISGPLSSVRSRLPGPIKDLVFGGPGEFPTLPSVMRLLHKHRCVIMGTQDLSSEFASTMRTWWANSADLEENESYDSRMRSIYFASGAAAMATGNFSSYRIVCRLP